MDRKARKGSQKAGKAFWERGAIAKQVRLFCLQKSEQAQRIATMTPPTTLHQPNPAMMQAELFLLKVLMLLPLPVKKVLPLPAETLLPLPVKKVLPLPAETLLPLPAKLLHTQLTFITTKKAVSSLKLPAQSPLRLPFSPLRPPLNSPPRLPQSSLLRLPRLPFQAQLQSGSLIRLQLLTLPKLSSIATTTSLLPSQPSRTVRMLLFPAKTVFLRKISL